MNNALSSILLALWLGILTSISPCPLASNIAAVSYISMRNKSGRGALASGLLYAVGRTIGYLAIGIFLIVGLLSIPSASQFLQTYGSLTLGPLLIVVGMFLLELIRVKLPGSGFLQVTASRPGGWGLWGAPILGFLFALSFCPVSAALFFGSLIPLALRNRSPLLLPAIFGIGTALPVLGLAFALSLGRDILARRFEQMSRLGGIAKRVTGIVFVGVGIYSSLKYIFLVIP